MQYCQKVRVENERLEHAGRLQVVHPSALAELRGTQSDAAPPTRRPLHLLHDRQLSRQRHRHLHLQHVSY